MTDEEYILGFRSNDDKVISKFYIQNKSKFCSFFIRNYNKDLDSTTELFQDSCIELCNNIKIEKITVDRLKVELFTYLTSIGKNKLMAKDRKFKEMYKDDFSTLSIIDEDTDDIQEKSELLISEVQKMGEPCHSLLDSYYWENLSQKEIAEKFGYSNADSVKTQKYKCIKKLTDALKNNPLFHR